ncbi:MAG: NAD(+) synthase [Pseudomonadota bacterium]
MFDETVLAMDYEAEANRICEVMVRVTTKEMRKRGVVVAVSGGIDSSTCVALAARAFGPKKVFALILPERDSNPKSLELGKMVCEHLGIEPMVEDIGSILEAIGCYRRRDEAIKQVFPEYNETYKQKIVVPSLTDGDRLTFFSIVIQGPDGVIKKARLPLSAYLQVVAATNFKQRTRKMLEYYHADRLNYAVVGTPNRLEFDQGFFVKGGDGLADLKPIAHIYKTQVYGMARHLGLPKPILKSIPTTDTYSLTQGQDEFYFALPYDKMDLMLYAYSNKVSAAEVAKSTGVDEEQVGRIFRDIETKRRTTRYLHLPADLIETIPDVGNQRAMG